MARYKHHHARVRNSLELQLNAFVPERQDILKEHLYLLTAPFVALGGLSPNEMEIAKMIPVKPQYFRKQAGLTNRWQFPFSPGCDLLGMAQANKATRVALNETLMRIMSVDTPVSLSTERDEWKTDEEFMLEPSGPTLPVLLTKSKPKHRLFPPKRTPDQMLFSYTQKITEGLEPDVILECLGFQWELHRMYLSKSRVLSDLLAEAIKQNDPGDTEPKDKTVKETRCYKERWIYGWKERNSCEEKHKMPKVTIVLNIDDPDVTRFAFAIALKNLYNTVLEVNEEDILGILATASVLQFPALFQKCVHVMLKTICTSTVCSYYSAGCKYNQQCLITECERWIEVNLVPQLGSQIHLRKLPLELLQKVLKSARLFTFNEFYLLRTALCWVFLQQNPKIQIIPSYDAVLTYFRSLPKICAFLEREVGQQYVAIFQSLRLHGITSSKHLEELWEINFLPLPWLTRILSDHYHAVSWYAYYIKQIKLENGGDMAFQRDFNTQAVRFGLLLTQEPRYHSEIISIYGFFFEIKAIRHEASAYSFYMQRVKHADPIISFFTAERSPVSLKQEREVKYEIKAQCQIDGKWAEFTTERLTQKFGVKKPSCKSKVLKVFIPNVPVYVTYYLLFPSSMG